MKDTSFDPGSKEAVVAFVLTTKCPVGCRHCITDTKSCPEPPLDSYRRWIQSFSESGVIQTVGLTGGEPFAIYDTLLDVVSVINENSMRSNVLTSAYWARSKEDTEKLLAPLVHAGLNAFAVSVDEFHQEKIPIQYVMRAIRTAKQFGLKVGVSFCYFRKILSYEEAASKLRGILGKIFEEVDMIDVNTLINVGRASRQVTFPLQRQEKLREALVCKALIPSVWPDGIVSSCCGPRLSETNPLIIGNLNHESFTEIYKRFREHPILPFLEVLGLTKMVEELNANGLGEDLQGLDAPKEMCTLCQKILTKEEYVDFFIERYHDPIILRQLGVKRFLLYGNTQPLLNTVQER